MSSKNKKSNSQLFKNKIIKFMVITNVFEIEININNICIIIHISFSLSLNNYI